ncbi:hypothetical protein Tco_1496814, partial [Tanacetum coccineum]
MNGFLVSQNAISNELNRMKNGKGTSHNGGSNNSRNGGRGYGRMSKIKLSKFHVDDVKRWVYRCRQLFKIDGIDDSGVGPLSGKGPRVIVSADVSILPQSVFVSGGATGAALK